MDDKTLTILEFPKILARVAKHASFSYTAEKILALRPSANLEEIHRRLALSSEARRLLEEQKYSIGGVSDVRQYLDLAQHGIPLSPGDLLAVQATLIAARDVHRFFDRLRIQFPLLAELAAQLPPPSGLVDAISHAISERGQVLDSASPKLQAIRSEIRVTHDRILTRLEHMVNDSSITPYLQESIITQRDGRYVIPIKSEYKGRIKAVVHDQSASGVTLFVEPLSILEWNNRFRELQLDERNEEMRILTALTAQVAEQSERITQTVEICANLDLVLASAEFSREINGSAPTILPRKPARDGSHPGIIIRLWQARHPLLASDIVVPIDVELDDDTYAMIITGPNTGGKTVTLKTIGLLILMAQSGLHIPAESGSEFSVFQQVYADIGDEQSIEQSLSTFSGHIKNIIKILKRADIRSLVILDELGAGTDPQEGAALARAILSHLLQKRISTLVTTHHPELKTFAHATRGVTNAAVEFDINSLRPTYHLTIGLPGRSNALAIAQRLGLPEEIIHSAKAEISPTQIQSDDLLEEIRNQRQRANSARKAAEKAMHDANAVRNQLSKRLQQIEIERRQILEEAHQQAKDEIERLREEIESLRRSSKSAGQDLQRIHEVLKDLDSMEGDLPETDNDLPEVRPVRPFPPITVGSKVLLKALGAQGVVTAVEDEEAEVQIGVMRMRARLPLLEPLTADDVSATAGADAPRLIKATPEGVLPPSPGVELDLRGLPADEAVEKLDRYLDSAYIAGLPFARIIHGKGTGRLRSAVQQSLKQSPNVASFSRGNEHEGGEGVTIIKFIID